MNRQLRITGLLIVFMILGIMNSYSQKNNFTPEYSTIILSNKGKELLNQCSRAVPEKIENYYDLTANEIQKLENNFRNILEIKSSECCMTGLKIEKLKGYIFQYTGIVLNGKKYIYINAFKVESKDDLKTYYKDWKTEPVIVCDGGESFWGALFELETESFSQLSINGIG
ncbi:MAG: hypothetical protein HXX16_12645 [Bacteroidales bacterium]|nr:hypothetical protein [Bacteroidales bacterium]